MVPPTISCVIPVWNGAAYLQAAIDSVCAQTRAVDEIIVVDDGSDDGSREIAARLAPRVRLIAQPHDGAAAARNRGIAAAQGALIALLDADDLWEPEKIEKQATALAQAPAAGCCFTHIGAFAEPGSGIEVPTGLREPRVGRIASTFLGRRDAIAAVGPFPPGAWVRREIAWFQQFEALGTPATIVPECLAWRRLHGGNASRRESAVALDAMFALAIQRRAGRSQIE